MHACAWPFGLLVQKRLVNVSPIDVIQSVIDQIVDRRRFLWEVNSLHSVTQIFEV